MKKMSKNVLFIVIGILVAFTIDVAAEAVISSGAVSYSNTTVSAALDELFAAVDINEKIGDMTEISGLGNGTITGAINTINNDITELSASSLKIKRVPVVIESIVGAVRCDVKSYIDVDNVIGIIPVIYNVSNTWNVDVYSDIEFDKMVILKSDVVQDVYIYLYILYT